MRRLVTLADFSLISGCGGESAFDVHYDEQAKQISAVAGNIQDRGATGNQSLMGA